MQKKIIFTICLFSAYSTAWGIGGPPLVTDDPGTPGSNKWEINLAATSETSKTDKRIELPLADINYGLGEHVQLKYEVPWVLTKNEEDDTKKSGFDRSSAGVKWRFLDKERAGIALSTYPQVTFKSPVSDSARNSDTETSREILLPIEMEESLDKWEFNQEVGYHIVQDGTNEYQYGLTLTYNVKESLALLAEFHGESLDTHDGSALLYNVGTIIGLGHDINLLLSVGRSFKEFESDEPHRALAYGGVQFHL